MIAFVLFLVSYVLHQQLEVYSLATPSDHDFSYMKSVYNASDTPLEDVYDYIIVGGGTAGCPLAATLSQEYSVLVLERGSSPVSHPKVLNSKGLLANLLQDDDGNSPAQRFISEDGVDNSRGRVLGGSSMLNVGIYSRADPQFYNESGIEWDMDRVEQAYQWVEDAIVFHPNLPVWQSNFKQALLEAGLGIDNGFNLQHLVGTKTTGSTFDDQGRRHGAVELLNRGVLKNLKIVVHASVDKIMFNQKNVGLTAIGVQFSDSNGWSHGAFVRDRGEVIVSAGAIGSPQLLLLSGIGPIPHLSSMHIPILHSNPNVGNFMADNPRNGINILVPFDLDPSVAQVAAITPDFNYIEAISFNLPFSFPLPFGLFPNSTGPINLSVASIVEKFHGPLSHGSLRLVSPVEVGVSPAVRFNYFEHPGDTARCVRGMRKVGDLLETEAMERFKFRGGLFKFLGPSLPQESEMERFCKSTVRTIWHYHGGCLVGKVVDGELRVMGTNSLRVVDSSVFTTAPGTNPQATVLMLGRYIGLEILQERRKAK